MKNRVFTILLIVSLALNLGIVFAVGFHWVMERQWHDGRPGAGPWRSHRMQKVLHLSKDQAAQIERSMADLDAKIAPLREDLRKKRTELFTMLKTSNTYNRSVEALIEDVSRLQAEIEKNVLRHAVAAKAALTPEQREKFDKAMERKFKKRRAEKRMPF